MQNLIRQLLTIIDFDSSGKSQSGTNQQDFLLKAILTEMQERQEDYTKLKEAIERLEVCTTNISSLFCDFFIFVR